MTGQSKAPAVQLRWTPGRNDRAASPGHAVRSGGFPRISSLSRLSTIAGLDTPAQVRYSGERRYIMQKCPQCDTTPSGSTTYHSALRSMAHEGQWFSPGRYTPSVTPSNATSDTGSTQQQAGLPSATLVSSLPTYTISMRRSERSTVPLQVYRCPNHGEFTVDYNVSTTVRPLAVCPEPKCRVAGDWVPQVVSFSVEGGTGAQRNPR